LPAQRINQCFSCTARRLPSLNDDDGLSAVQRFDAMLLLIFLRIHAKILEVALDAGILE